MGDIITFEKLYKDDVFTSSKKVSFELNINQNMAKPIIENTFANWDKLAYGYVYELITNIEIYTVAGYFTTDTVSIGNVNGVIDNYAEFVKKISLFKETCKILSIDELIDHYFESMINYINMIDKTSMWLGSTLDCIEQSQKILNILLSNNDYIGHCDDIQAILKKKIESSDSNSDRINALVKKAKEIQELIIKRSA
jgi:hypothetical protein